MGEGRIRRLVAATCAAQLTIAGTWLAAAPPHHRHLTVHSTLLDRETTADALTTVVAAATAATGWWEGGPDGAVVPMAGAAFRGSAAGTALAAPIVAMAATRSGNGYWLLGSDGGIFSFGDAAFHGSTGAIRLNQPVVGISPTPTGSGYWLVARDGGIFSFGDARFHGSTGGIPLNQPIVGMSPTPTGNGYWLVARDGGIFSFGDAVFAGSAVQAGAAPAVGMVTAPHGYWVARADGTVAAFGGAAPLPAAESMPAPAVAALRAGTGVVLVTAGGEAIGLAPGQHPVVLAGGAPAGSPSSYTFLAHNGDGSPIRWNPCAPVHYVLNPAEAPAGAPALVREAFDAVTNATGITFVYDGTTTEVPSSGRAAVQSRYGSGWAPVLVAWALPSQTDLLAGNVAGEGGSTWVQTGTSPAVYVTGQAVINAANTSGFPAGFGAGQTLGELLLHELGHVAGLGHTTDGTQVMFPTLHSMAAAAYGAGDATGLGRLGRAAGCLTAPAP